MGSVVSGIEFSWGNFTWGKFARIPKVNWFFVLISLFRLNFTCGDVPEDFFNRRKFPRRPFSFMIRKTIKNEITNKSFSNETRQEIPWLRGLRGVVLRRRDYPFHNFSAFLLLKLNYKCCFWCNMALHHEDIGMAL